MFITNTTEADTLLAQLTQILSWARPQPAIKIGDSFQARVIAERYHPLYGRRAMEDYSVDITIGPHADGGWYVLLQPLVGSRAKQQTLRVVNAGAIAQAIVR